MSSSAEKNKCNSGIFKRLNYFQGMLLTQEDFQEEQHYVREKLKLHNRLHGHGAVWGLQLTAKCVDIEGTHIDKIFIEPGFALDCAGNEILVCQSYQLVEIEKKILSLYESCKELSPPPRLFIGLEYCECNSNPQTQYLSMDCGEGEPPAQFARVQEGFDIRIFTEEELPGCCSDSDAARFDRDCVGLRICCEDQCVIFLGCIKNYLSPEGSSVDSSLQDSTSVAKKTLPEIIQDIKEQKHPFPEEVIDTDCKPPYLAPTRWERQKQMVLQTIYKRKGWVDLTPVIGQSVKEAEKYLVDNGLQIGEVLKIEELKIDDYAERITTTHSFAEQDTTIDLLVDYHGEECVLFVVQSDGGT